MRGRGEGEKGGGGRGGSGMRGRGEGRRGEEETNSSENFSTKCLHAQCTCFVPQNMYMINKLRDTFQTCTCIHVYIQSNTTTHEEVLFPRKMLPQVGLHPTTLCSLDATELLRQLS